MRDLEQIMIIFENLNKKTSEGIFFAKILFFSKKEEYRKALLYDSG